MSEAKNARNGIEKRAQRERPFWHTHTLRLQNIQQKEIDKYTYIVYIYKETKIIAQNNYELKANFTHKAKRANRSEERSVSFFISEIRSASRIFHSFVYAL